MIVSVSGTIVISLFFECMIGRGGWDNIVCSINDGGEIASLDFRKKSSEDGDVRPLRLFLKSKDTICHHVRLCH